MASSRKSLIVRLKVIKYQYRPMFYDQKSGRAATSLRSCKLPSGSKLELWRNGEKIADATVALEGYSGHGGDFQEVFMGESFELIEPEARLMRSQWLPSKGKLYAGTIETESLRENDEVILTLTKEGLLPESKRTWSLLRWFKDATYRSQKAAYEAPNSDAAQTVIGQLFRDAYPDPLDATLRDFREKHRRAPWREQLELAFKQLGARTQKRQSSEEIVRRLQIKIPDNDGRVALVRTSGERLHGKVIEINYTRCFLLLHIEELVGTSNACYSIRFDEIRRVV